MSTPEVSIVICTHNRAEMLRDALGSLVAQEARGDFSYEVLVVDNASTDSTSAVIEQLRAAAAVPVRSVYEPRAGQVVARNRGIREARGEWIANFDDDQIAEPIWLAELLSLAKRRQVRSVGGALRLKLPEDCLLQLPYDCRRILGESVDWRSEQPYTRREGPGSGNQMLHRSVFDQVGLYDESYTLRGYDSDLYRRMRTAGIESWYTPKALAYHVTPEYRLTDRYFRETCLHNGWFFARRDLSQWSRPRVVSAALARAAKACATSLPRLAGARLRRDREQALAARTRLWTTEGYLRSVLFHVAPWAFSQSGFFSEFEFRAERRGLAAS